MKSSYKYSDQIALHNKAVDILNMKIEAIRRLDHAEIQLSEWDRATAWDPIRLTNNRSWLADRVETYRAIVPRITRYYAKHALKVCTTIAETEEYDRKVQKLPVFGDTELMAMDSINGPRACRDACNYGKAELNSHQLNTSYDNAYES